MHVLLQNWTIVIE